MTYTVKPCISELSFIGQLFFAQQSFEKILVSEDKDRKVYAGCDDDDVHTVYTYI